MPAIHDLTADELSSAYMHGALSPVTVVSEALDWIERWEPQLNAMYVVHRKAALAAAAESEARWREGRSRSVLDGVPVTVKENLYTEGDAAPLGTGATALSPKGQDSPPAARLREAGCVILGKTTMPDYGMLSSGRSSFHGTTRNPWNTEKNTAGSSSGAGAAAAAGYGPLHVGTDIGGSVRLPAALCGIYALKPSLGRIPIDPPYLGRAAGPMTRTVRDAAMLMDVLTRPDSRDFMSLPPQPAQYALQLEGMSPRGLRFGLLLDAGAGLKVEPAVLEAVREAAAALEAQGAIVEPIGPIISAQMLDGMCAFFEARSFNDVNALSAADRAKVLPFIVEWATWRAKDFSGADVMAAWAQVMAMREATVRATQAFDFVLSPTSPVASWAAEAHSPNDDPHDALAHIAFTVPYNMSEQPAASINWRAGADGLPLGVQIAGQRFDDMGVLRISRAMELLRGEQKPWPQPAA